MRGSSLFAGLALVGVLVLVPPACSSRTPSAHPAQQPLLQPVAETVGAAADPPGWAERARQRCDGLGFDARSACYDEVLGAVLQTAGVGAAMETLERIGERDPEIHHHGHVLAHHLGIAAYRSPERVAEVFAECRPSFQSGCYHGVIQAYFADAVVVTEGEDLDEEPLNRLCAAHRGADGNRWLLFQCVHGMGHGLVALHGNHLPRALAGCDLLGDPWEREGCYGGAFMENVVSATMPHHAPRADHPHPAGPAAAGHAHADDAHAGDDAHTHHGGGARHEHDAHPGHGAHPGRDAGEQAAGHDHAGHGGEPPPRGATAGPTFRALDPADPHYPCTALDDRYLYACYTMQTSAVLFWSEGDIAAGIELCDGAPERVRRVCYVSLGRDINAYTRQHHATAIDRCLQVAEPFQPHCLVGVAKNLIDLSADPADGLAFCRALAAGTNRERCFQAVGEQVAVLEAAPERRAAHCRGLEADDARACRFGAGVPDDLVLRRARVS